MVVGQKPKYRIDGNVVVQDEYPVMDTQAVGNKYLFEIMTLEERHRYLEALTSILRTALPTSSAIAATTSSSAPVMARCFGSSPRTSSPSNN